MGEEGGRSRAVQMGNWETEGSLQGRLVYSKPSWVYRITIQWEVLLGLIPQTD
ncbi:hypothetical protein TIFTF001_045615 [Ficus carica]|uniref:Uncharacterized protein n=1 Tax=Ficus carica TaxID=3494 RepID=A0AA87YT14_FICCA|nr:hypothetical protein TIFTF001_045615 [Ficus carica]